MSRLITPERTAMARYLGFNGLCPEDWPDSSILDKLIECKSRGGKEVLDRVIQNIMFTHDPETGRKHTPI